jgi:hypothetical protein
MTLHFLLHIRTRIEETSSATTLRIEMREAFNEGYEARVSGICTDHYYTDTTPSEDIGERPESESRRLALNPGFFVYVFDMDMDMEGCGRGTWIWM